MFISNEIIKKIIDEMTEYGKIQTNKQEGNKIFIIVNHK
jgi:hypothetical protein